MVLQSVSAGYPLLLTEFGSIRSIDHGDFNVPL
jgi:hypothetical protein